VGIRVAPAGWARGRPLGPVALKGKGEIEIYRCDGVGA
jgi:hypothetical protein